MTKLRTAARIGFFMSDSARVCNYAQRSSANSLKNRQKTLMGKQDAWTCTSEAAKNDFGYNPRVDLAQGVGTQESLDDDVALLVVAR